MAEPVLTTGPARSNVFDEHVYKIRVTFGAASIASYRSLGATIARNSAGNYTVTLQKPYEELVSFVGGFTLHAAGAHLFWSVKTSTLSTAGAFVVECRTEAGVATDPASGDKVTLSFGVSSDDLNSKFAG